MAPSLNHAQTLRHVDYFAGMQAVTNAFLQDGQVAIAFELKNDPLYQSMNTDYGFIAALLYNLKIVDGGGFLAALYAVHGCGSTGRLLAEACRTLWAGGGSMLTFMRPMSRWVCSSSSTTTTTSSSGSSSSCSWMAAARGLMFIVEQPKGSLLEHHPRWQQLARVVCVFRHYVAMSSFGSHSEKGTWLYSN